jgi:hypothetical protein
MIQNDTKKTSKNIKKYVCEKCDFICVKIGDWNRHLSTRKHTNDTQMIQNDTKKTSKKPILHQTPNVVINPPQEINVEFQCHHCNKMYKHKQNLSRHYKTCKTLTTEKKVVNETVVVKHEISTDLILEILKENKEMKHLLVEQNKTIIELSTEQKEQNKTIIELSKNNQIVNSTVNSHNKTFNLQFFLNETCKDAMNIKDFVHSIQLQLTDLENVGHVGFVNGITKIIIKNLKSLKQENRPVHCTDEKRKIIYIKDSNKWEKEDDTHKKVRNAIKHIARNNFQLMYEFKKMYPCCVNSDSRYNNMYLQLMNESLGGSGNSDSDNETKIITNISKEILIEK